MAERYEDDKTFNIRVCNSDDAAIGNSNCVEPTFEYAEIRIAPGDWESAVLVSPTACCTFHVIFGVS